MGKDDYVKVATALSLVSHAYTLGRIQRLVKINTYLEMYVSCYQPKSYLHPVQKFDRDDNTRNTFMPHVHLLG